MMRYFLKELGDPLKPQSQCIFVAMKVLLGSGRLREVHLKSGNLLSLSGWNPEFAFSDRASLSVT